MLWPLRVRQPIGRLQLIRLNDVKEVFVSSCFFLIRMYPV